MDALVVFFGLAEVRGERGRLRSSFVQRITVLFDLHVHGSYPGLYGMYF